MVNKKLWLGISVLVLMFGMVVLGACVSAPSSYEFVQPIEPDKDSAVVYFVGGPTSSDGCIWDGDALVGDFNEIAMANIAWKTTPGEHYFIANTFNWVVMKANLEPNKSYYIKVDVMPNPVPYSKDIIIMNVLKPDAGDGLVTRMRNVSFTDDWRTAYLAKGKRLQDVQEQLKKAQDNKAMEVSISGANGK